jgi:hypothetical protein
VFSNESCLRWGDSQSRNLPDSRDSALLEIEIRGKWIGRHPFFGPRACHILRTLKTFQKVMRGSSDRLIPLMRKAKHRNLSCNVLREKSDWFILAKVLGTSFSNSDLMNNIDKR